jgi:DNA-binding MarR family transcriptional regulator
MHAASFAVNRIKWKLQFFYDDILEFVGLTDARLRLMQTIASCEAPWEALLAAKLGITPQTVGETLHSLERLGHVTLTQSELDGRKKIVDLTPKGRATLARVRRIYLKSGLVKREGARCFIDAPKKPEKLEKVVALMRDARSALFEQSTYRPEAPWDAEIDDGASLDAEDKATYDAVVAYCDARFLHLPFDYLMSTWGPMGSAPTTPTAPG